MPTVDLPKNRGICVEMGEVVKIFDPTVPAWARQPNKPIYTAKEVGAIPQDELQSAVNTALAAAKESGEFDGEPGYTPQKRVDYWTDADKAEMVADVLAAIPVGDGVEY